MADAEQLETDVLIVGAGPVGMITALLLARVGLTSVVVEKRPELHPAPQAHVIYFRAMEILRQLGLDETRMRAAATQPADLGAVRWVKTLAEPDIGALSLVPDWAGIQTMLSQSPTTFCNLSQHLFEPILYDALVDEAATSVMFGHAWQGFDGAAGYYESRVVPDAGDTPVAIRSRYIIGADGAGSSVRDAVGIAMQGPDQLATFCNIHFSANLRTQLTDRAAVLYWVMDPAYAGAFIAHNIDHTWVYMKVFDPNAQSPGGFDADTCRQLLQGVIGHGEFEIENIGIWTMTAQVAEHYGRDNVLLVGDAAHRFPPTGGVGMNTGIQDAHNLVWKLARVEQGFDRSLLDTYQTERRPVAVANSEQSVANHLKMGEVARAIGLSSDPDASRRAIEAAMSDPQHQARVQAAIDAQGEHFNMRGLDLGYCYRGAGIIADGEPPQPEHPVSEYLPSTTPGTRLPHAWLERDGSKVSTLDLIDYQCFTLFYSDSSSAWAQAVEELAATGLPITGHAIGPHSKNVPADDAFANLFDLTNQPLLVRPDGHVCWRGRPDTDPTTLGAVMALLLPKDATR